MQKIQCVGCGQTICFAEVIQGMVEIKCRQSKCKTITRIECHNGRCIFMRKSVDKIVDSKKICYN